MKSKLEIAFLYVHIYGGSAVLLCSLPVLILLTATGISPDVYMPVFFAMLGFGAWSGLVSFICAILGVVPKETRSMQKAEMMSCLFQSFEDMENVIGPYLKSEYTHYDFATCETGYIEMFARRESCDEIKCVTIARVSKLSNIFLEQGNDVVQKFLETFCGTSRVTNRIIMTSFFCVDRVTPAFYHVVDKSELLDYKVRYLPIGISFGGKKVYIANPKRRSRWYKAAREEVIQLLSSTVDETSTEST